MSYMRLLRSLFFILLLIPPQAFAHGTGSAAYGSHNRSGENSIASGPTVNSPTASTLGKHRAALEFQFNYLRFNSIPAGDAHRLHHLGRDVHGKNHEQTYHLNLGYGILEDLDFYLDAPIVSKNSIEVDSHSSLGKKQRATGFGDMRLSGKYRFWKRYVEAALLAGLQFPTGRTNTKKANGSKFEIENQPGSGSWDADFGIALSRSFWGHFSVAESFQYFLRTKGGQELEGGDIFQHNLGFSYSLRKLGKLPNLSLVAELNQEWALKDRSRTEARVFDSGGTTLLFTPGLVTNITKNLSAYCALPIPIYQNLGGEHEELTLEVIAGINITV